MSFNKSITNLYEDFYGKEFIDNWEVVSEIKDDTLKTGLRSKKPIECIEFAKWIQENEDNQNK